LNRRESRLPTFKITIINILIDIKWFHSMNEKFILHFSYSEHFLVLISILAPYVLIWVNK
jgi:hypothetical protein